MDIKKLFSLLLSFSFFSSLGFAQYATGCLVDSVRYMNVPMSAPLMRGDYKVPTVASLKEYCPIPGDQGNFGTCTAWSAAYASRTILYAKRKNISGKEALNNLAFSPSYVYNQIRITGDCFYGAYISDALYLLKTQGCLSYKEFGYECDREVKGSEKSKASKFVIQDYKRLFMYGANNNIGSSIVRVVKKSLAEGKPVVVSMRCFASFEKAKGIWNPPTSNDANKGYHAMTVVGYDDTKFGGAVEIMNSWGSAWGNEGFIWMKYSDFEKNCVEAYELGDFPPDPKDNIIPSEMLFAGEVSFKKSDGQVMAAALKNGIYKMKQNYYSGTSFQFFISHQEPVYMYAVGSDLSNKFSVLFPYDKFISPLLSYKRGTIAFPSEDHYLQLDQTKGSDFVCVFYSKKPLNIEALVKKMESGTGSIKNRVYQAINSEALVPTEVQYKSEKISFNLKTAKTDKTIVVPLIIEIEHQ
jgi:hypothetical protein